MTCSYCGHAKSAHEGLGGCHSALGRLKMENDMTLIRVACGCQYWYHGVTWNPQSCLTVSALA